MEAQQTQDQQTQTQATQQPQTIEAFLDKYLNNSQQAQQPEQQPAEGTAEGTEVQPEQQTTQQPEQQTTQQPEQQPDQYMQHIQTLQRQLDETRSYLTAMSQLIAQQQQMQQPTGIEPIEPEIEAPEMDIPEELPEELQKDLEELWIENPAKAMVKLNKWQQEQVFKRQREREIRRQREEMQRRQQLEREYAQAYTNLIAKHGQQLVEQLGPRIDEIMTKERPYLLSLLPQNGLELALELALQEQQKQQAQASDPLSFLQQAEVKTKLKEALKDEIIREYLTNLNKGNSPVTIASQPGGAQPLTPPPEKPKTLEEAKRLLLNSNILPG